MVIYEGNCMEKKYKFSEFADILGITSKTVYRMESREEIRTVKEKVNNRLISLVVATDEEIEKLKENYSKFTVNNSNYEDILTNNNNSMNGNDTTQNNNNADFVNEIMDKVLLLNEEFMKRLNKVSEELANSKAQVLYLEDKAGREGAYLKEINDLKKDNEKLKQSKQTVFNTSLIVISLLLLVIIGFCMFNFVSKSNDKEVIEEMSNNQVTVETPTVERVNKKR